MKSKAKRPKYPDVRSIRIPDALWKRIIKAADKEQRSIGMQVCVLCENALAKK